jgi:hypothetical protein
MKDGDGENVGVTDVRALPIEHGLELSFLVDDLMKHW